MEDFKVSDCELRQLSSWHRDQQWECANKEKYDEAKEHKTRWEEIEAYLESKK